MNIITTIYGRNVDTYLNGKLINTCSLDTVVRDGRGKDIYISETGHGFNGYTSKFQYFDYIINPQKAWDIYAAGFDESNWLQNLFASDYGVKFTWMEDGEDSGSIEI